MKKKILITGGYGFIGSFAVQKYLNMGHEVLNIDKLTYASDLTRLKNYNNLRNYRFIKADIKDQKIEKKILRYDPDIIINFAAETHVDNSISKPSKFVETNINGTYNLLNISLKLFKRKKLKKDKFRFIQISTDEVFGTTKRGAKFNEKSPYKPNSPYSSSKASADLLVRSWNKTYGLPTIITYCTNNFGPKQDKEKFIPTILNNLKENKKIPIYGSGKNMREWIFVKDHVEYIYYISFLKNYQNNYFISDGNLVQNIDLVKKIIFLSNKIYSKDRKFKNCVKFVKDRLGHDFCYTLKRSKYLRKNKFSNFNKNLSLTIKSYL